MECLGEVWCGTATQGNEVGVASRQRLACHASVMRGEVRQGRATHGLGVSIGDVGCGVVRSGMVGKAWQRKICRSSNGKARLAWVRSVLFR